MGKQAPLCSLAFFQLSITQSFSVVGIAGKQAPLYARAFFRISTTKSISAQAPMCDTF